MDWKQPVKAGDRLRASATWHNRVTDAARLVLDGELVGGGEHVVRDVGGDVVRVLNTGTSTLGMRTVAVADGTVFDLNATNSATVMSELSMPLVMVHAAGDDGDAVPGRWVVVQEPIKPNGIGRAVIGGLTACWVDVKDMTHKWAEHRGGTGLTSCHSGSARLMTAPGDTPRWLIIRMGDQRDDCVVLLDSTNAMDGCYNGRLRTGTALATGTSAAAILGGLGGSSDALIINGYEVPAGTNGHALAVGTNSEYHGGWIIGSMTNGRAIVLIRSLAGEDCA